MIPAGWLLLGAALAQQGSTPDTWARTHDVVLGLALSGDLGQARVALDDLVHNQIGAGDPALIEAQYHLARVRTLQGDLAAARDALDACIRTGQDKARCLDLRSELDMEAEAVSELPIRWTFATEDHGLFHPRAYWDKGTIRIRTAGNGSWLAWSTRVDATKEDRLVVPLRDPSPSPSLVRVRVESMEREAALTLQLTDADGARFDFPGPPARVRPGKPATLSFRIADARPAPGTESGVLDPSQLYRIALVDVTALLGTFGPNELRLTSFELR